MLVDMLVHARKAPLSHKIFWLLVVVLLPVIGFIIYSVIGRNELTSRSEDKEYLALRGHANNHAQPQDTTLTSTTWTTDVRKDLNNPVVVKKQATVLGTVIGTIAVVIGAVTIGFFILVAVVMYQCSRPGAKCM